MRFNGFGVLAFGMLLTIGGPVRAEGVDPKKVKELLGELKDTDPLARVVALQGIAVLGPEAQKDVGAALISQLKYKDSGVRIAACAAIGVVGLDQKDQSAGFNALIGLLGDSQITIRIQAAATLAKFGPQAKTAIPVLIDHTRDPSCWEMRKASATALAAVAHDANGCDPKVLHALTDMFKDDCMQVKMEALASLIVLGPPPPNAANDKAGVVKALDNLLKDKDKALGIWTRMAYMRMDKVEDKKVKDIVKLMTDSDASIRMQAVRAVGMLGPDGKAQIPDLVKSLDDKEPMVVIAGVFALGGMGKNAKDNISDLKKLKDHKEEMIRKASEEAIKAIEADINKK